LPSDPALTPGGGLTTSRGCDEQLNVIVAIDTMTTRVRIDFTRRSSMSNSLGDDQHDCWVGEEDTQQTRAESAIAQTVRGFGQVQNAVSWAASAIQTPF
jgi:hypothetical protein